MPDRVTSPAPFVAVTARVPGRRVWGPEIGLQPRRPACAHQQPAEHQVSPQQSPCRPRAEGPLLLPAPDSPGWPPRPAGEGRARPVLQRVRLPRPGQQLWLWGRSWRRVGATNPLPAGETPRLPTRGSSPRPGGPVGARGSAQAPSAQSDGQPGTGGPWPASASTRLLPRVQLLFSRPACPCWSFRHPSP